MKYLLDSNAFIEPYQRYYPFALVPQFWQLLELGHENHMVFSLDGIRDELKAQKDQLSDWVLRLPQGFFLDSSAPEVQHKFSEVMRWVTSQDFHDKAKDEFAAGADGWLVAYAEVNTFTIVTQESLKPKDTKRHVAIPNVCEQFKVNSINVFELFKRLSALFDISDPR